MVSWWGIVDNEKAKIESLQRQIKQLKAEKEIAYEKGVDWGVVISNKENRRLKEAISLEINQPMLIAGQLERLQKALEGKE